MDCRTEEYLVLFPYGHKLFIPMRRIVFAQNYSGLKIFEKLRSLHIIAFECNSFDIVTKAKIQKRYIFTGHDKVFVT